VQHTMTFEAMPGFMFSDIMVEAGSVLVGFTLTGPYSTITDPTLFRVTISGSAQPVPEPAPFELLFVGVAGLALARRRRVI
jgi:hypothetical protein